MTRRELGAGVSVMWVIFLIVILIGAGAYIYLVQSDMASLRNQARAATQKAAEQEALADAERTLRGELSDVVGFKVSDAFSSKEAVEQKIQALKDRFPDETWDGADTLELVVEKLAARAEAKAQDAETARSQFESERQARQDAEASKDTIETNLTGQISSLNNDLRDARDAAQAAQQAADDRYSQLQDQLAQANASAREREDELLAEQSRIMSEAEKYRVRVESLAKKVELLGEAEDPWAADGKVLAAGEGVAYIDIGGRDLLLPGVKFDVYYHGKGGERIKKGELEARTVESGSAMCAITTELNPLDPIAKGDFVANPAFSRERSKVFVLIGEFPVYGRTFLQSRLESIGATVSDTVHADVDFVLLGTKAPEEDALEPTELPEYKLAQEFRIQVLRVRDVEHFLKP